MVMKAVGVEQAGVKLREAAREQEKTRLALDELKVWVHKEIAEGSQISKMLRILGERDRAVARQFSQKDTEIVDVSQLSCRQHILECSEASHAHTCA